MDAAEIVLLRTDAIIMISAKPLLSFAIAATLSLSSLAASVSEQGHNQGQYVPRFIAFGEAQSGCGEYLQAVEAERKAKQPGDPLVIELLATVSIRISLMAS